MPDPLILLHLSLHVDALDDAPFDRVHLHAQQRGRPVLLVPFVVVSSVLVISCRGVAVRPLPLHPSLASPLQVSPVLLRELLAGRVLVYTFLGGHW